jgi:DNA-binding IclR family transcriptional regulator
MPRCTTYRYLQRVRSYGLVEENDSSGGFRLGLAVFRLARAARQGMGLSEIALPVMHELVAQTGETALLTRRTDAHVVCIERVESQQRVRLSYERGQVLPLHAGASAKVLLAYLDPEEIEVILSNGPFPRYTEHTMTDPDTLREQLEVIRSRGYAMSEGEVDDGVRGVAAPIFDAHKRVVAGLSVAGPAFRINDAILPGVIQAVQEAANRISSRIRDLDV